MEKSNFESTQEFYDQWINTYKATMGKLVELLGVGPAHISSVIGRMGNRGQANCAASKA